MSAIRIGLISALVALLAVAGGPAHGQDAAPAPWRTKPEKKSPVSYSIEAEMVETGQGDAVRIVGKKEKIVWENTSREPVKAIYLHAYANAFRNTRSTFLREAMRDGMELPDDMRYADLRISSVSTPGSQLSFKWVSLDDGNADDRTVARIDLPEAVETGGNLLIQIEFTLDLPSVVRRMGAQHGFVMAAQWFPKLGMYVGRDSPMKNVHEGWYCHQFHANCEFAADFADYDVKLTFPSDYVVGATGMPQGSDELGEKGGVKVTTRRYKAEGVVDFAWTAGKGFVERSLAVAPAESDKVDDPIATELRRMKALPGVTADDVALPTTEVVLLLQPEHLDQAERHFEAARVALGMFGAWLGPYPYPRLTIVDPPWSASAGGMEYPMLVTAGTVVGSPQETQRPEWVIVHEICHQWLMGMIANNEAEEAWLDEGINTYLTSHAMHLAYRGPAQQTTDILGFHFSGVPVHDFPGISAGWPEALDLPKWARPPKIDVFRIWRDLPPLTYVAASRYGADPMLPLRRSSTLRAGLDEMVKPGWKYADRTSYRANAYSRPALFLNTLRRRLAADIGLADGERRFFRAVREYAREQRFRHPTTDDFLRKFKEIAGDPTPAADQLIRTASTLDYSIESIRSGDDPDMKGIDDSGAPVKPPGKGASEKDAKDKVKSTIVRVRRRGDAVVPIELVVQRDGAPDERVRWETKDQTPGRWYDFGFSGKVVAARLDPDGQYLQDVDLSNDSYAVDANSRPAVKWSVRFLGWFENALVSYGRFF